MARLNIEDQFWMDIVHVAIALGDHDKAIGMATRWLRFAQEHHKADKLVSEQEFIDHKFHESLMPYFAKRVEGGIIARGAEKHFGWLKKKAEAGAKGGKQTQAKRSTLKHSEASYSLSPSVSKRKTNTMRFLGKEEDEAFETWWSAWPNKVDHNEAKKAFKKKKPPIADLLTATEKYKAKKPEWQNYCNGATFINSKHKSILRDDYGESDDTKQRMMSV